METAAPERLVVQTTDLDEAITTMRATFGDVDLCRDEHGETTFSLRSIRTAELESVRWHVTGVGAAGRDDSTGEEDVFLTGFALGGLNRIWSPSGEMDAARPFLYPEVVESEMERVDVVNLAITRARVVERARALTGVDDLALRFTGTAPIDPALDPVWRDTVVFATRTLEALADHPDSSVAQAGLVDLVTAMLLRTYPNTALDVLNGAEPARAVAPVLRRAVQFVDDNLGAPISVTDIARAARLSTRGLYAAFRRDMGMTPMEYLRSGRLSAVHEELLRADPGTCTVTDIAVRWGFTHAGRFAEQYRTTFGEAPKDTLRR